MDDIVTRLRIEARRDPEIQHTGHSILSDAADEIERLRRGQQASMNWLRRQASAEKEPKVRAAFIEAHNAVRSIVESRPAHEQKVAGK